MKLFACVCLLLVILEEYHCKPCFLRRLFGGGRNDNDREKNLSVGLGLTAKTTISGQSEDKHENGYRPSYHPRHRYQPYGPNGLGHRPNYQPYYSPPRYPSYRTPYSTRSGRPFGATYNIPYDRQGGAWNGIPQYRTPYHRGSFGTQYGGPRYGTLYPTPLGTTHQTPNGAPNGSPFGTTNGSPNSTPNGSPSGTTNGSPSGTTNGSPNSTPNGSPSGTPNGSPMGTPAQTPGKTFFVTPTGIQETPAQSVDNAS